MKNFIQLLIIFIAVFSIQYSFAAPTAPAGWTVRTVASGGLLAGEGLDGIIVDPVTANVYVATAANKLFKITPEGVVSLIVTLTVNHVFVTQMAWGPDGNIYTLNSSDSKIYKINPATGVATFFGNAPGGAFQHGLNFDSGGNLIFAREQLHTFYRITPGGPVFLGTVSPAPPNGNHGDAFGIQPNGNYVVYTDCGGQNDYAIATAGHVDGAPYTTLAWTGTTDKFTIMSGCGYSCGTIDPITGDVYSTINNFGSGNDKIILTGASGGASTVFISGGSGITNLYSGKASNGSANKSLYFVDKGSNTVYEVIKVCLDVNVTFSYTGGLQTWTVPAGVTSIDIEAWGAQGGKSESCTGGPNPEDDGGLGGKATGTLAVVPGQTINVYVGEKPPTPIGVPNDALLPGGFNGGGTAGKWGGGGGGASDIRIGGTALANRVLVAGGGGGGNTGCGDHGAGGNGGGLTGANGLSFSGFGIATGGTQVAGGSPGNSGFFGSLGFGGNANMEPGYAIYYHFAGGGGGYYGGGSAFAAGGGGGSSYIGGVTAGSTIAGVQSGNGLVTIKYMGNATISCPGNISVSKTVGTCYKLVTYISSSTGSPSPSVSYAFTGATTGSGAGNGSGSLFNVGTTTVTLTADNLCSTASCSFTVTVTGCGNPTQVYHTDTTSSAGKSKWKGGLCATGYELRIRKELSPGVWGAWSAWVMSSGSLEHQFSGLSASSFYNYQLRTNCGGIFSVVINDWFHTLCAGCLIDGGHSTTYNAIDQTINNGNLNPNEIANTQEEIPMNLTFAPNPANDFTAVSIQGFEQHEKTITMFDLFGKLVFNIKVDANQNQLELELARLNVHNGVYIIRVSDGNKQKSEQLIIQK